VKAHSSWVSKFLQVNKSDYFVFLLFMFSVFFTAFKFLRLILPAAFITLTYSRPLLFALSFSRIDSPSKIFWFDALSYQNRFFCFIWRWLCLLNPHLLSDAKVIMGSFLSTIPQAPSCWHHFSVHVTLSYSCIFHDVRFTDNSMEILLKLLFPLLGNCFYFLWRQWRKNLMALNHILFLEILLIYKEAKDSFSNS